MPFLPNFSWLAAENQTSRATFLVWVVTALACMANFIDMFQSSMVNFGLAEIMTDLDMNPFDINWVVIAYNLAFAAVLPCSGAAADRFGLRFGFLLGTGFLAWSNVLCGWTPNKYGLIVGRAFSGVGAALSAATGPPIISHLFTDEKKRNFGLSLLVMCGPLGMVSGMILGAVIVGTSLGWRALFWLCFALNAFLCLVGIFTIPHFARPRRDPSAKFDTIGLAIFVIGLPLLIYGVDDGGNYGWTSPAILVTLILGGLMMFVFPFYERRLDNPLIPKPFLYNRNMVLMLLTFLVFGGGFSTWFFLVTQVFLNTLELTALRSALYLLPAAVCSILSGVVGSLLATVTSERVQISGAYLWLTAFLIPWGLITLDVHRSWPIVFSLLYMFGNAPGVVRAQATVLRTIPKSQHGQATAMLMVAYQTGSGILLALVNAVAKSTTGVPETPASLLRGYKSAFWLLLGISGAIGLVFCILYRNEEGMEMGSSIDIEELTVMAEPDHLSGTDVSSKECVAVDAASRERITV